MCGPNQQRFVITTVSRVFGVVVLRKTSAAEQSSLSRASLVKVSVLAGQVRLSGMWAAGGDTAVSPGHVVKLSILHWRDTAIPLWHQLKSCSYTEPTMQTDPCVFAATLQ